jgi:hypothetical protein
MGGPSRESYRRSQAAKQRRLDALRTRGGVVDLAEWRAALRTLEYVRAVVRQFPIALDVRLAVASGAGFELVVTLVQDDRRIRALPSSANDVPVRVEVRNPDRAAATVSAPLLPSHP